MLRLLLTFLAMAGGASCASEVLTVEGAIQSKTVQVTRDGQPAQVNLQVQRMTLQLPSGKTGQGDLLMLYDPQTQLFWWHYSEAAESGQTPAKVSDPLANYTVYITGAKIVVFTFSKPSVWVRESTERYPSLAEGQAGAQAALRRMSDKIEGGAVEWFREINVLEAVGRDFLSRRGSPSPFPRPKLREVSRTNNQWHLILDGPNKDSAEVVLSDDYQVVEAKRLPGNR
jgi:hypothetical protein